MDQARRGRALTIVRSATVIGWHRRLVARHWTQPPTRQPGRPPVDPDLRRLIVRLARENPTWGYRRVHGELHRLGQAIAASTVWKILRAAGFDPRRDRTGPSWSEFIRSQAKAVIATDFACVDTAVLRRFHVLFVIEVAARRVQFAGITTNPTGEWTTQVAGNLLMRLPDHHWFRFLVRGGAGAGQFTEPSLLCSPGPGSRRSGSRHGHPSQRVRRAVGADTSPRAPRPHDHLERAPIAAAPRGVHRAQHTHRPHRGRNQRAPDDLDDATAIGPGQPIRRHRTCGGLINEYRHAA
jgi:hypothetical protein